MRLLGFAEADIDAQRAELHRRVDELDAMIEQEKRETLIPRDRVLENIRTWTATKRWSPPCRASGSRSARSDWQLC
jgi:hypothetical protein